jgi:hypothetical protein
MNITIAIERLVVEGVQLPPGGERAFRAALEAELTRLLATGGVSAAWHSGGAVPSISVPPISAASDPAIMGRSVAQSVYAGVGDAGGRGEGVVRAW